MTIEQITLAGSSFSVETDTHSKFWSKLDRGVWEPSTVAAIQHLVQPGTAFIDIGGWIGPTTLLSASLGARVLTFEPDPVAHQKLMINLQANPELQPSITVLNAAASSRDGKLELFSRAFGDSQSSVFDRIQRKDGIKDDMQSTIVNSVDIRPLIDDFVVDSSSVVVKIDIEGGEYSLFPAIADYLMQKDATVLLSTHPHNLVGADDDDTLAKRVHATAAIAEAIIPFTLMGVSDFRLKPLRKEEAIIATFNRLTKGDSLIASPRHKSD